MIRLACLALAVSPAALAQATWYVDPTVPGPGSGNVNDPYRSVQFAIDAATTTSGDTLSLAAGTYFEALDLHGKALRLVGDPNARPVLNGIGAGSVVRIASGEGAGIEFHDLVFTGGSGSLYLGVDLAGGGVYIEGTSASFFRCRFEGNRACQRGGAIAALPGDVFAEQCEFVNNRALRGGAIELSLGTLTLDTCSFEGNGTYDLPGCALTVTSEGGAVFFEGATLRCTDSTFRRNYAGARGGAMHLGSNSGASEIEGCLFEGNGRRQGTTDTTIAGAVSASDFILERCVFIGNHSRSRGGAVVGGVLRQCRFEGNTSEQGGAASESRLEECFVYSNHAVENGGNDSLGGGMTGGVAVRTVFWGNTSVLGAGACHQAQSIESCTLIGNRGFPSYAAVQCGSLRNSIVFGNRSIGPVGPVTQAAVLFTTEYSLIEGQSGGLGGVSGLPLLFGEHVGDAHLLPGSPAIDAANPALPLDPDGTRADIGALPYDPAYRAEPARFCAAKVTALGCLPEIQSLGTASLGASTWRVEVAGTPIGTLGLALLATRTADTPFFGGHLCLGGPILRAVAASALPASGCGDVLAFDVLPGRIAATGVLAGDLVFAQVWFRDALHPDGTGVGISDALVATVTP